MGPVALADDAAPPIAPDAAPAVTVTTTGDGAVIVVPGPGTPADRIEHDPVGTVQDVIKAARAGQWRYVAAVILGGLMVLGIRFGGKVFGSTQRGKAGMVAVLALLGAFSSSLATSMPLDGALLLGALGVAWLAVGMREWLSAMLWPKDGKPILEWLRPILGKT